MIYTVQFPFNRVASGQTKNDKIYQWRITPTVSTVCLFTCIYKHSCDIQNRLYMSWNKRGIRTTLIAERNIRGEGKFYNFTTTRLL